MLRRPDSIPKGDTVIVDPVMEPFFIAKSTTGGYTVYQRVVKGDKKTPYIKTVCYPSTFNSALKVVSRELLNNKSNYFYTIKEYIKEWQDIQEKMSTLTSID